MNIEKERLYFEEFDQALPLPAVMERLADVGYHAEFLNDVEKGLKTSSIKEYSISELLISTLDNIL